MLGRLSPPSFFDSQHYTDFNTDVASSDDDSALGVDSANVTHVSETDDSGILELADESYVDPIPMPLLQSTVVLPDWE